MNSRADSSVGGLEQNERCLYITDDDAADCPVRCQYNRDRFPAKAISDVVHSHRLLADDATVSHSSQDRPPARGSDPYGSQPLVDTDGGRLVDTDGGRLGGADRDRLGSRHGARAPAPSATDTATGRPVRVLFVDDEAGYAEMVSAYLEESDGIDAVVPETDPHEALDSIEDGPIDCVVSDYDMPGLDGLELLERVRADHPDLPFVMLTGKSDEETAAEAISAGVTDYFRKRSATDQYTKLAHRISNVVRRHRAELEVAANRRQYTRLIEEATDVVTILDETGRFEYLSPAAERRLEYPPEELVGEVLFDFVHPADRDVAVDRLATLVDSPRQHISAEFRFQQRDGSWLWVEARGRNLLDDPDVGGIVMHARDITDRKEREQTLAALHGSSRELLGAESETEVADSIVDAATDVLSMSVIAVYLFDPSEGVLTPTAVSSATVDRSSLDPLTPERSSLVGETFLAGDPRRVEADVTTAPLADLPVARGFLVPIGDHGVCVVGETESKVTDTDRELVETLTATAATALNSVERGAQLTERTAELEEQNRQLEQLRQLNVTVREIGRTIAQADTRAAVEEGVCRHLSTAEGIGLVRISGYDSESGRLVPREREGSTRADGYLDAVSVTLGDSTEPAALAAAAEDPVYVQNIANVMNAVEHQNAVLSETMTEVTIRFTDERMPLYDIASRTDCSLALETVTPRPGDDILKIVRVDGADTETVADVAEDVPAVSDASLTTDADDEPVVKLEFSNKPLTDYLADHGIRVLESVIDAGSATFTLSVPDTTDVRELFESLGARYGHPELVAKTEKETARNQTAEMYRSKLTPRQQEVLRTAYADGFFESPRACTAEDVADELDIAPQTFYRHVRTIERKLFSAVFDAR